MTIFLILTLIFLFPITSWGANCGVSPTIYYVDYVNGNNAYDGTHTLHTTGNTGPWQTAPHGTGSNNRPIPNCTLQPGDVVVFKGGVLYQDAVNPDGLAQGRQVVYVAESGSAQVGNIVYDGDSGTYTGGVKWGNGTKAVIDGQYAALKGIYLTPGMHHITVNGFVVKNLLNTIALQNGQYSCFIGDQGPGVTGCYNITISNNDMFRENYTPPITENTAPYIYNPVGRCITHYAGDNWTIHDNTFADCGAVGIDNMTANHTYIYNNHFTGVMCWTVGLNVNGPNQSTTDFQFHDNVVADMNQLYSGLYNGCHQDYLYIYAGPTLEGQPSYNNATYTNFGFYNNLFYVTNTNAVNSGANFLYLGMNADGDLWNGLYIFNNVFINQDGPHAIHIEDRSDPPYTQVITWENIYILNNSWYSVQTVANNPQFLDIFVNMDHPGTIYNFYGINNIVYTTDASTLITIPLTAYLADVTRIDHNIYNSSIYGTQAFMWDNSNIPGHSSDKGSVSFSTWQTWHVGSNYFDPRPSQFGVNPYFRNAGNQDLHLTAQSTAAIGTGGNLTSWCTSSPSGASSIPWAACRDRDGNVRPTGSTAWDIGAYQFTVVSPAQIPSAPGNLRLGQ